VGTAPVNQGPSNAAPGLAVPVGSSGPLGAAIGGTPGLSTSLSIAGTPIAPAPLSASTTLPPTQASQMVPADPTTGAIAGPSDVGVRPQNLPEPGAIAIFLCVFLASAMKAAVRRRSGRTARRRG
jgi:hypothetical protein